jgi:hypothetical protein
MRGAQSGFDLRAKDISPLQCAESTRTIKTNTGRKLPGVSTGQSFSSLEQAQP